MQELYWRNQRPDTVRYAPLTDSVPTPVQRSVRACAARFPVATTPIGDVLPLAQLFIWAGDHPAARAAEDRLIAAQRTASATTRAWTLELLAATYLTAKPVRMIDAARLLTQLDALGVPAAASRMRAHKQCGDRYLSLGDLSHAETEFRAAIQASQQISRDGQMNAFGDLVRLYMAAAEVWGARYDGTAALRFVDSVHQALAPLRPAGSQEVESLIQYLTRVYQLYGMPAPRLTASHWYPPGDSMRPTSGVVSLLIFGSANCGGRCYPQYATMRRLATKYGVALQMTIITGTGGYYHNHPMPAPSAEADSAGRYFLDFLHLPVAVAESDVAFVFQADRRRVNQPTENVQHYARGLSAVLVGRDGRIKLLVNLAPNREQLVDKAIETQLATDR